MQDYEKLGVFYLGKRFDTKANKAQDDLLLYESKDLTTHGVCVGMTGSGKTGLCLALLEEAAIDGIPAIAIDPKGDIANLLLTFPELRPADFAPWVDAGEAQRLGVPVDQLAAETAAKWKQGLAEWGQEPERIARLRQSAEFAIYTPGSKAGRPLALLRSFTAPPAAILDDSEALRDRILASVSGLLALVGIEADPMQSREHILLSRLLQDAWSAGKDLDVGGLIQGIQKPGFDKVGVLDLESFYPAKERFALAMQLNNLLASPGAAQWMEGEPLDVARLLYTPEGKPRVAVLSIAHLSDAQRMFFVTTLLNEVIAWMRTQSGTSSLRALLYMDEIFGYFPPTAMPPSKTPMLTLLKQARAFGLGVVLATQNPVDLDYKGLSNAGTWFIGRLQTERDKLRVLDGLEGAAAGAGKGFDRAAMDKILSGLGSRVFLMNNVHDDGPVVFQTRWTMSYLRGPVTRDQIRTLTASPSPSATGAAAVTAQAAAAPARSAAPVAAAAAAPHPVLPPEVPEVYLTARPGDGNVLYRPGVYAAAKVHYVNAKAGVDAWQTVALVAAFADDDTEPKWDEAAAASDVSAQGEEGAGFDSVPGALLRKASYATWKKAFAAFLYQGHPLTLYSAPSLGETSKPDESLADFRARIAHAGRESRDQQVEELKQDFGPRLASLQEKKRKALERVEREKAQSTQATLNTVVSVGATLLDALFGRKTLSVGNIGRASTAVKSGARAVRERQDVTLAGDDAAAIDAQLVALQAEFDEAVTKLQASAAPDAVPVEELPIAPRKADIAVGSVALAWIPWRVSVNGVPEPA